MGEQNRGDIVTILWSSHVANIGLKSVEITPQISAKLKIQECLCIW